MFIVLILLGQAAGSITPDQAVDYSRMAMDMFTPPIADFISRISDPSKSTPMYERKTQAPTIWIHMRKAKPIIVDNEFYNISTVPGINEANMTQMLIPSPKQVVLPQMQYLITPNLKTSFVQTKHKTDPIMIQNGLYLTMPLRQPPQETMNIAAVEDTRTIQGVADYRRKKREIERLKKGFTDILRKFNSL